MRAHSAVITLGDLNSHSIRQPPALSFSRRRAHTAARHQYRMVRSFTTRHSLIFIGNRRTLPPPTMGPSAWGDFDDNDGDWTWRSPARMGKVLAGVYANRGGGRGCRPAGPVSAPPGHAIAAWADDDQDGTSPVPGRIPDHNQETVSAIYRNTSGTALVDSRVAFPACPMALPPGATR